MKIVFMGTPDFAVPCLEALINNKYNIIGVVTQPDKPKGRGYNLVSPPIKELAIKNNLPVFQPEKVKNPEFIETLMNLKPDLIIVVAFGQILPKAILDIPRCGCINIHGSLLPKYRGAAPIQWAVINGEKTTGVTSMYMDVGMDTGDMILKKETEISENETVDILFERLSKLGAVALIETIKLIENDSVTRVPQDHSEATYAPMICKENGCIDWNKSAEDIKNLVRGTYTWPCAYTFYKDNKFKIHRVEIINNNISSMPGQIVDITKDSIVVQTGKGLISLKEIQLENCKRMSVKDYLIGHAVNINDTFTCGVKNGE